MRSTSVQRSANGHRHSASRTRADRVEAWPRSRSSRASRRRRTSAEVAPESDVAERKEALDDDVDAILDEIDDVLETNAEDFVKSFIQKGGQ